MSINKTFQDKVIRFVKNGTEYLLVARDILISSASRKTELESIEKRFEVERLTLKLDAKTREFCLIHEDAALDYLTRRKQTKLHDFVRESFAELNNANARTFKTFENWLGRQADEYVRDNNIIDLRRYINPNNRAKYLTKDMDLSNPLKRAEITNKYIVAWLQETYPFRSENQNLFWLTCSPSPKNELYAYLDATDPEIGEEDPAIQLVQNYLTEKAESLGIQAWLIPESWTLNSANFVTSDITRDYIEYTYTSDKNEKVTFVVYV
jgi:hypothetical protein